MSREEAIKVLKEYLELDKDIDNEYLEAQRVVIKAMKQEPALDKIRTEIEKQDNWLAQAGYNAYNVDIAFNSIKRVIAESEVKQVDENEFETLAMIIEHLENVEDMAYKKFNHYFDNKNYDKAHIFMALSNRINLEIQMLEIYIDMEDK